MTNDRVCIANAERMNSTGRYVLYWPQMFRRLHSNHALDHALRLAAEHRKPLVVYEGLKLNYPWANARHHTFILQGMRDNAVAAKRLGLAYWPFVETPGGSGRGLVARLAQDAVCVVTDDYPAYIVPAHNRALAAKLRVPLILVDGNGVVPLSRLGAPVAAAAHLRPRIHKLFAEAWRHRATNAPDVPNVSQSKLKPPFEPWDATQDIAAFVASLPVDQSVPAVAGAEGGSVAGGAALELFVSEKLFRYAEERNGPDDPANSAASGLSAYLHYGHISIEQVTQAVLGDSWTEKEINPKTRNKDDFFCRDPNVNSFLDEAITWRDVGYHWHFCRNADLATGSVGSKNVSWWAHRATDIPQFNFERMDFSSRGERTLEVVLPEWARGTLKKHAGDPREHIYSLREFEAAGTHDPLWNAAQTELVCTGRIHNYLRMLWGKKVLEWSATPADAYRTLEHLNNKYALDGRDPNSYTGIHWCFGLFDRPWPPERAIFGTVRYMSSENTARKFDLGGYYDYIARVAPGATRD